MPLEDRDPAYLWDILQAAKGIVTSVAGQSFDGYQRDPNLKLATERRLEIIGEAARRVSEALRAQHPEIPWRSIIGLRNVLAHEYDEIDDERVWRVAVDEIPRLVSAVEPLVPATGCDGD